MECEGIFFIGFKYQTNILFFKSSNFRALELKLHKLLQKDCRICT